MQCNVFPFSSFSFFLLQQYSRLRESAVNSATLDDIETSAFIVVLDDSKPEVRQAVNWHPSTCSGNYLMLVVSRNYFNYYCYTLLYNSPLKVLLLLKINKPSRQACMHVVLSSWIGLTLGHSTSSVCRSGFQLGYPFDNREIWKRFLGSPVAQRFTHYDEESDRQKFFY